MRRLVVIAAALIVTATAGVAQSPIPDLKGTWKGTGKILLFGTTEHLTGSPQNAVVRDLEDRGRTELVQIVLDLKTLVTLVPATPLRAGDGRRTLTRCVRARCGTKQI